MYQYLSWVSKDSPLTWKGNKLLSEQQIGNLKAALLASNNEIHESIQRYDRDGNVLYTPLYADFDGEGCDEDVLNYVNAIESEFNISPDIFFSGRKGYHVIINTKIYHSHPHLVAKDFAQLFSRNAKTLDLQVYATMHKLRSEGSIHFKSGLRKTKISKSLIGDTDAIKQIAKAIHISNSNESNNDYRMLNLFIPTVVARVDMALRLQQEKYGVMISENAGEVSPCIRSLLNSQPVPGSNNKIITLVARNLNSIGMDLNEAIEFALSHEHWKGYSREIKATFVSIWKRPSQFGCHKEDILKEHCDVFCIFNSNVLKV